MFPGDKGFFTTFFATFGIMALLALVLNLAFWGGLIWVGLTLLQHFGVI